MLTKGQYFGMYIGKFILNPFTKEKDRILKVDLQNKLIYVDKSYLNISDCKLILRPLKEITEADLEKINRLSYNSELYDEYGKYSFDDYPLFIDGDEEFLITFNIEQLTYLISKGYDIFNLKEKGFAIYESEKGEK